mgnify:CR=1 FL=1
MNEELKNLIAKTENPAGLARIFEHIADRLDGIVAERRRTSPECQKAEAGHDDGRA